MNLGTYRGNAATYGATPEGMAPAMHRLGPSVDGYMAGRRAGRTATPDFWDDPDQAS